MRALIPFFFLIPAAAAAAEWTAEGGRLTNVSVSRCTGSGECWTLTAPNAQTSSLSDRAFAADGVLKIGQREMKLRDVGFGLRDELVTGETADGRDFVIDEAGVTFLAP